MKIYNINNTKELFDTIAECKGSVELVGSDGSHLKLNKENGKNLDILSGTYVHGSIDEIELSFENGDDAMKVFQFLSGIRNVA
ncbi:MAG: hypothetical protein IKR56_00160 [Lachnospiraceae bacterium]|nr:hypothetical protein [Lachnospiraceae bacterium]